MIFVSKNKNTYANRGMTLEKIITKKCNEYIKKDIAYIYKIPTDWVVIRKGKKIISAFPKKKSIVDYLGVYNGLAIAIEAKSTTNKTSFPFKNIADHQWIFFKKWCTQANGYYIIWFKKIDMMFLVDAKDLQEAKDTLDRKSAPLDWFKNNAIKLDGDINFIKHIK